MCAVLAALVASPASTALQLYAYEAIVGVQPFVSAHGFVWDREPGGYFFPFIAPAQKSNRSPP